MIDFPEEAEWLAWTPEAAEQRPEIMDSVKTFECLPNPAGEAAAAWLREHALQAHPGCRTYLLLFRGAVQGYYALTPGTAELRSADRTKLGLQHPTVGAVLIVWLGRCVSAEMDDVGSHLLLHAVAVARRGAEHVGGEVLALDPYDEETAELWRARGFRNSRTRVADEKPLRMWQVLYPG